MKKKVLIVDDDIMTLRILKKYLEDQYEICMENAGYRLAEKPGDYDVDLILLDIEMPVMNGIEVFEKYISDPMHKEIPIVFLSGVAEPEVVRGVIGRGAAGYVVKNSPKEELLKTIERLLNEYEREKHGKSILIISDKLDYFKDAGLRLKEAGYLVSCALNMYQAAEIIRVRIPDCIIAGYDEMGTGPTDVISELGRYAGISEVRTVAMEELIPADEIVEKVGMIFVS